MRRSALETVAPIGVMKCDPPRECRGRHRYGRHQCVQRYHPCSWIPDHAFQPNSISNEAGDSTWRAESFGKWLAAQCWHSNHRITSLRTVGTSRTKPGEFRDVRSRGDVAVAFRCTGSTRAIRLDLPVAAQHPVCAACFSQIQERESRRAPTPRYAFLPSGGGDQSWLNWSYPSCRAVAFAEGVNVGAALALALARACAAPDPGAPRSRQPEAVLRADRAD